MHYAYLPKHWRASRTRGGGWFLTDETLDRFQLFGLEWFTSPRLLDALLVLGHSIRENLGIQQLPIFENGNPPFLNSGNTRRVRRRGTFSVPAKSQQFGRSSAAALPVRTRAGGGTAFALNLQILTCPHLHPPPREHGVSTKRRSE